LWSPERLHAVLAHELAHIVRRDLFLQRLSLVYRACTWFSPLSWWLHRHLAELAEQASDVAALEAGADTTDYAETLLAFFADLRHPVPLRTSTVARARDAGRTAERRLDRVLAWKRGDSMKLSKRVVIVLVLAAVPVAALTAAARVVLSPEVLPLEERIEV